MVESLVLFAADGTPIEAERALPPGEVATRARCVLCHPHPQFGGTMRSIVVGALFAALPADGIETLRFNFRGVEGSGGTWDDGAGERLDVEAAVDTVDRGAAGPLLLVGWSFGADVALSVTTPRVDAWMAIAPPLRWGDPTAVATDARPKLLALAEHDEVRAPGEVASIARDWATTEVTIVAGASHFFLGRTDRLVELALGFVDRLGTGPATSSAP